MKMKNLVFAIGVLLIAACGKSGPDVREKKPEPEPPQEKTIKNGQTVRVMTYNIHHANPPAQADVIDIESIAAVINQEKPDIAALQEVDVRTKRSGVNLDQAQHLAARTGMYVF